MTNKSLDNSNINPIKKAIYSKLFLIPFTFIVFVSINIIIYQFHPEYYDLNATRFANTLFVSTEEVANSEQYMKWKISLLKSENLTIVTQSILLGFVPIDDVEIDYGHNLFRLTSYGLDLTEEQYQKILSYLPISTHLNEILINNTKSSHWILLGIDEFNVGIAKDGYLCSLPSQIGPTLCSADGSGCMITYPYVACINSNDPRNNTTEHMSPIVKNLLKESGITCNSECEVVQNFMEINIPKYSRRVVYFLETTLSRSQIRATIKEEISKTQLVYLEAGWDTKVIDTSEEESKHSRYQKLSKRVIANNDKFSCSTNITEWGKKIRYIVSCHINEDLFGSDQSQSYLL